MTNLLKSNASRIAILGLLLLGYQNCARIPLLGNFGAGDSSSVSALDLAMAADPVSTPYALLNGEQLLKGMLNVTGAPLTGQITNEFNSRSNAFSTNPDLKSTTSPMMIAVTSVGGEVCNSLLTTESAKAAADRAFFGAINFATAASLVDDSQFGTVVRSMARNFWGRNVADEELAILKQGKTEFMANLDAAKVTQAVSTRDLMLFTCSAMISSVDATTY